MYVLGVSGAIGMFNVVAHTVFARDVAASIGWPAGNPFQTEVGFANMAIGIVGFACFWRTTSGSRQSSRRWCSPGVLA